MKKLGLFLLLLFVASLVSFSQNKKDSVRIELHSIDISAGRSALSSGFSLDLGFRSNNANTLVALMQDRVFLNHLIIVPRARLSIGPSVGFMQDVPFIGAIAQFSPMKFLSTLHWFGYSFGEPGETIDGKPSFLFLVNGITITVQDFKTYYQAVSFMKLPTKHVVGISYQQPMAKSIYIYGKVGYDFTSSEQLLQLGVVWRK